MLKLSLLLAFVLNGASAFAPTSVRALARTTTPVTRTNFWKKNVDDEPLNPDPVKKPSVWTASVAEPPPAAAPAKRGPAAKAKPGTMAARKAAKGTTVDPYRSLVSMVAQSQAWNIWRIFKNDMV